MEQQTGAKLEKEYGKAVYCHPAYLTAMQRKTRDLFKKIRDTKGTFYAKMGSIKARNGRDLTGAEDIKRWQEYTEELYKKRPS